MVSVKCHSLMLQTRCKIYHEYSVEIKITICTLDHYIRGPVNNSAAAPTQRAFSTRAVSKRSYHSQSQFIPLQIPLANVLYHSTQGKKVDVTHAVCVLISLHILHQHCLTGFSGILLELSVPICWLTSLYTGTQAQKRPPYSFFVLFVEHPSW